MELCAELLVVSKLATNLGQAKKQLETRLGIRTRPAKFQEMITALGGPADFCKSRKNICLKAAIIRPA